MLLLEIFVVHSKNSRLKRFIIINFKFSAVTLYYQPALFNNYRQICYSCCIDFGFIQLIKMNNWQHPDKNPHDRYCLLLFLTIGIRLSLHAFVYPVKLLIRLAFLKLVSLKILITFFNFFFIHIIMWQFSARRMQIS